MEETKEEKRLDFVTIRDEWCDYEIKDDNTRVRIKFPIANIIDTGKKVGNMTELKIITTQILFKEPSMEDKGKRSPDQTISDNDILQEMQFYKIREVLNIYEIPDTLILLQRVRITKIQKTKKFDKDGNRLYQYAFECSFSAVKYPK